MIPPGQNPPIKNPYITKEQIIEQMNRIRRFNESIQIDYGVQFFDDTSRKTLPEKEISDQRKMAERGRRIFKTMANK